MSDRELGKRLGVGPTCIAKKREQLDIPAFVPRWTDAEVALLGSDTDDNIAKILGRTEEAVKLQALETQDSRLLLSAEKLPFR